MITQKTKSIQNPSNPSKHPNIQPALISTPSTKHKTILHQIKNHSKSTTPSHPFTIFQTLIIKLNEKFPTFRKPGNNSTNFRLELIPTQPPQRPFPNPAQFSNSRAEMAKPNRLLRDPAQDSQRPPFPHRVKPEPLQAGPAEAETAFDPIRFKRASNKKHSQNSHKSFRSVPETLEPKP